ncbi:EAL domain-containing protein [Vibrio sp. HN007]|uniref:EAL domain-containing protein n=1 Tax=Vibrio iocasae TaxID=3098914 RepID=UPI0035D4B0C0
MTRFLWFCTLLLCHSVSAANLTVDDDFWHLNLTLPLETILDNNYSAEQVLDHSAFDTSLYKDSLSPNSDTYWYRINISASQLTQTMKVALVSQSHLQHQLDLFLFRGASLIKSQNLGIYDRPPSTQLYEGIVFKFSISPNEKLTLLIRKQSDGPAIMPLKLMDELAFKDDLSKTTIFWGVSVGVLFALAIYNTIIFSLSRNNAQYGWYLLFQIFIFLNFAPLYGFGYVFFPDSFVRWLGSHMGTLHLIILWCALMFGHHFLDINKYRPRLGQAIEKSGWLFIILLFVSFQITELQRMYITSVLIVIVSYICISSAFIAYKQKYHPAFYYLLSWLCTFAGACTGFLTYSNLLPQNLITLHSFMLGVMGELYLLSVSLAKRIQYHEELDKQHRLLDQALNMPNQTFYRYSIEKQFRKRGIKTKHIRLILIHMEGLEHLISALGAEKVAIETRKLMYRLRKHISKLPWQVNLQLAKDHFGIAITPLQTVIFVTDDELAEHQVDTLLNVWQTQLNDSFYFSDIHLRAACVTGGSGKITSLHQKANMALLEARKKGVKWLPYNEQMTEEVEARIHILHELRRAITDQKIDIYIQPKVNLSTNQVIGGEALMRWHHDSLGMVPPNVFIPLAEQSGVIHSLTRIAIEKMFAWIAPYQSDICLSINISAIDLRQPDFIHYLEVMSQKYDTNTSCITLEITESQELEKSQELIKTLAAIKALGFAISLDDFGTGYSSMAYLSQLDIDEVKVDMIFVKEVQNNPTNQTIIKTLFNMAETLQANVVVEGIETVEELTVIKQLGGQVGQGYHWSPAIAAEQFEQQYLQNKLKQVNH